MAHHGRATRGAREITHVGTGEGAMVPLAEWPCANCGTPGCTHIAISDGASYAFCSWDHLMASMRIDDQPLTEELMREAGVHVIGPRPEA